MNYPNLPLTFSVRHDQQPTTARKAETEKTGFGGRMVGIGHRQFEWIAEHSGRFQKVDAVFLDVCGGLVRIPLEFHVPSLPPSGRIRVSLRALIAKPHHAVPVGVDLG